MKSTRINHVSISSMSQIKARMLGVLLALGACATALVVRAVDLQIISKDFYIQQGDQRFVRTKTIAVSRGTITDRNARRNGARRRRANAGGDQRAPALGRHR